MRKPFRDCSSDDHVPRPIDLLVLSACPQGFWCLLLVPVAQNIHPNKERGRVGLNTRRNTRGPLSSSASRFVPFRADRPIHIFAAPPPEDGCVLVHGPDDSSPLPQPIVHEVRRVAGNNTLGYVCH